MGARVNNPQRLNTSTQKVNGVWAEYGAKAIDAKQIYLSTFGAIVPGVLTTLKSAGMKDKDSLE